MDHDTPLHSHDPATARPARGRIWRATVFVAVAAVFAAGFGLAIAADPEPDDHGAGAAEADDDAAAEPSELELVAAASVGGAALAAGTGVEAGVTTPEAGKSGHGHGPVANVPIDDATRDALATELVEARAVALRYPTVADAEAAGYKMVTGYVPLIGAHYIRFDTLDLRFDLAEPEMLLYDGTAKTAKIVGLSYYMLGTSTEPDGFVGPNDHWHQHDGLCLNRNLVVVGGESTTPEECAARGGQKVDGSNAWMVHAWVVPGWESIQGVFSAENPDLL